MSVVLLEDAALKIRRANFAGKLNLLQAFGLPIMAALQYLFDFFLHVFN